MSETTPYRVLARKYRPQSFADLIGQGALVRTLSNAINQGRIAHAFILTGVRGIGKTTSARIIARALNCTGPDGTGGPTLSPCGLCDSCKRIAEDRHVDVIEMDAASRTGIDDIREIIEAVRYAPASARYKIYIIDEVHMLSTAAFNGLLKTLEEPPPHVKFIFATTEIRKVPITVLSRCQRFDLRRIEAATMIDYLGSIAAKENVTAEPAALALIARAAEGSMRDGLSLLDQAIAHGNQQVDADTVRAMLGLADRIQIFLLYDLVMQGDIVRALETLGRQYEVGADPVSVLQDMLELTHWLTRIKLTPDAGNDVTMAESERAMARDMAEKLSMPVLARSWQMLLQGMAEVRAAARPIQAAEMVLIRLAYVADLPSPADLVRELQANPPRQSAAALPPGRPPSPRGPGAEIRTRTEAIAPALAQPVEQPNPALPQSFDALIALAGEKRDLQLKAHLINSVHLVRYEIGRIEIRPTADAPHRLANELAEKLQAWTGTRWAIGISREEGAPTVRQQQQEATATRKAQIETHPLVKAVLLTFPGASVRLMSPIERDTQEDAPEEELEE